MHGKRHGIDVETGVFMRNTVQLGVGTPSKGGHASRVGFFSCYSCNWRNGDKTGVLLQANLSHVCRCGKPMLLILSR